MAYKIRNNIPIPQFRIEEITNRIPSKSEMFIREKTAQLKRTEEMINVHKQEENKYLEKKIKPLNDKINSVLKDYDWRLKPPTTSYPDDFDKILIEYYTSINYHIRVAEYKKQTGRHIAGFDTVVNSTEEQRAILKDARHYIINYYQNKIKEIVDSYQSNKPYTNLIEEADKLSSEISALHKGYSIEQLQTTGKLIDTNQLINMKFDIYEFSEGFESILGHPEKSFVAMIHGTPGSGKSSFAVKFASYFNNKFGKVCYLPIEEGLSFTFMQKVRDYAVYGDFNIMIETLPSKIQKLSENYSLVIIDSISQLNFNTSDIEEIIRYRRTTNTSFLFVMHQNKDKSYKGESSMAHLVDIQLESDNGIIMPLKNRFRLNGLDNYKYTIYEIEDN